MKIKILLTLICALALNTALAQQRNGQAPAAKGNEDTLSFGDIPELKEAYISTSPGERNDGILVGKLGIDGGNKAMILKLAQEMAEGKHGNFDSYLIAHKGKLIFESYYRRGRINLPHPQASATKTYTSMALGRAIQLGYLTMADLNKPLTSFLKELDHTKFVAGTEKITLHQALTMRSGIQLSAEQREEIEKNPAIVKGQKHLQAFLENSQPITDASQQFAYKDDPRLVMQVIEAVVPGTAKDFIKRELLDKMDITNYEWLTEINGLPRSGSGTSLTSRDMLKWGLLIINNGKWKGEQLVPADFVEKATSKIVNQSEEYDDPGKGVSGTAYGYFTWQTDFSAGDKSYLAKSARGGSGQNIYIIEALDLVVVTTTHRPVDSSVSVTAERVLPAFIENAIPTKSAKSDSPGEVPPLEDRYLGQKPPGLIPEVFAPGLISINGRYEHGISFSPAMDEVYFSANVADVDPSIYFSKLEGKKWTIPKKANFTKGKKVGEMHPFVSPDGDKIYFTAHDAFTLPQHKESVKAWYVNRLEDSWSSASQLDSPVNDDFVFYANQATNGDLFYTNVSKRKMYFAPNKKGKFPQVQEVDIEFGFHGFIAPSQDYLVVNARIKEDAQRKDSEIYVYFKKKDGTWSKPINLGKEVNSNFPETCPSITPDGKYLFFGRYNEEGGLSNFYWVSTEVIERVKPADL